MTETIRQTKVVDVRPELVNEWLAKDEAALVDVREDFEHAAERIEGAHHRALSQFDPAEMPDEDASKRIVFQCRTGSRSAKAAEIYRQSQNVDAYHLAGGIEGWKAAGLDTLKSKGAPKIDVMRQVQITAGSLVLLGVLLGAFVSPWFLIISGFVGGGLAFAGLSGWCGMAKLLSKMPWNRVKPAT